MNATDILTRAKALRGCKYWYGGKRELASRALADRLKKENPATWTDKYYNTALKDIDGKTRVCDCSGLVCYAYGISDIGSYNIKEKYSVWAGTPRAGMIAWKKGHVGIFSADGWTAPIIEMRSQAYDYQNTRTYKECGFTAVLYDKAIDYDKYDDLSIGWHRDAVGWWYRHTRGTGPATYYHDCFITLDDRHRYCFDSDGYICELTRVSPNSARGWID